MHRLLAGVMMFFFGGFAMAAELPESVPGTWFDRYQEAYRQATAQHKSLLLFFHDSAQPNVTSAVENSVATDERISRHLDKFVLAKLPLDYEHEVEGEAVTLLHHSAFHHLHRRAGLAIVQLGSKESPQHGRIVSIYPFSQGRAISADHLAMLLALPDGTLTQRTMMLAVWTHPERPRSVQGEVSSVLLGEAQRHSSHQAQIQLQGHHNWDSRFHQINAQIRSSYAAREVVAESWPGQDLWEAARECVASWRQSSGHWEAVSSFQPLWGFDIQRGNNGIWYATGIFASRH